MRLLCIPVCLCVFGSVLYAEETKTTEKAPKAEVKLVDGDWATIQKVVKDQKDKVVVVDIWSTSCLPCMEEYPNLLKLQKKYGKKIVCVSLNVDFTGIKNKPPEYYRGRVEKFLNRRKSTIKNFLCTTESIELFDQLKLSSIPAVYVFNKDGKLAKRFDDSLFEDGDEEAFTYKEDINPLIENLMK